METRTHNLWLIAVSLFAFSGVNFGSEVDENNLAYNMASADTHWAFVPLQKPAVPYMDSATGNEVDAFVLKKLREEGLNLNPSTDKRSLLRRVTYGLTGLPPTYKEITAFEADNSPDAYEKFVERLLDSPAYGERWARHWLDVARYADTKGRPNFRDGNRYSYAHTYRDYVIDAFNEDKPYDEFIIEQIAADHLDLGADNSELAALGFLTLGKAMPSDDLIDDQIDSITRGLQGLTVSCARCHDHKFDPIPTSDYYSLHGIFKSTFTPKEEELPIIRYPKNKADYESYLADAAKIQKRIDIVAERIIDTWIWKERSNAGVFLNVYEEAMTIEDDLSVTGEFTVFAQSNDISQEILRLWINYLKTEEGRSHPVLKEWFEKYANGDRKAGEEYYNELFKNAMNEELEGYEDVRAFLADSEGPLNPDRELMRTNWLARKIREPENAGDMMKKRDELEWSHPGAPYRAHVVADIAEPQDSPIYMRGNVATPGEIVPRQFLEILSRSNRKQYTNGSGRLELAQEIANKNNPLTARVFVNRAWGWHTGTPFVDTPSDFGVRTTEPAHVDLLNWLAASFIESGWSIKALHKWIVLSQTYRQSSTPNPEALAKDSENTLWHHFPKMRLDFESMRDTILKVAGNLDQKLGGVQVDITDPTTTRRTIYNFFDRSEPPGIFRTFDHPSPNATSPARFETIVPQQALFMINSQFMIHQAKQLANRVTKDGGVSAESGIEKMYRDIFQRKPSQKEIAIGMDFVKDFESYPDSLASRNRSEIETKEPLNAWELYAQLVLSSNELIFLD